jgi:hypothetical protein
MVGRPRQGRPTSQTALEWPRRVRASTMSRRVRTSLPPLLAVTLLSAACGARVDLASSAKLANVTTGWYDAGLTEDGQNKLVPSISLQIRNEGAVPLSSTQLNMIFKRVIDQDEWTSSFVRGIGAEGLAPGATTRPVVVRARQGYTGRQPRAQMLSNSRFVDFKVEVFGKHGSATWVKLGEFPIARQLLTR